MLELLPTISGKSALEAANQFMLSVSSEDILNQLPPELLEFVKNRFLIPASFDQPDMPLLSETNSLQVTFIKKIAGKTKDKTFDGQEQITGTIIGKSIIEKPFPLIILAAWVTRQYGYYDQSKGEMVVYCESRDGITPSIANEWGTLTCTECQYHPKNRPDWKDDPEKDDRCKQKISIFGLGGDWKDFYLLQISGLGIIDFYGRQIGKEISAMKRVGEPYYHRVFMVGTERDTGGEHRYKVVSTLPTIRTSGTPDSRKVFWEFDKDERDHRNNITLAALSALQKLGMKYRDEFQERGKLSLKGSLEIKNKLASIEEDDDSEKRPTGKDLGLD